MVSESIQSLHQRGRIQKKISNSLISKHFLILYFFTLATCVRGQAVDIQKIPYEIYPSVNPTLPELPSPFITTDGREFVIAATRDDRFAIIPVTLHNERQMGPQLVVDSIDFPALARTGLHAEGELLNTKSITGRSLSEITQLGRPGMLSQGGFMAADENILAVMVSDNRTVLRLGLTHPQLARPLFHVLNMMEADLTLDRWNMRQHRWDNIRYFFYHGKKVHVIAEDTKGGQKSIFNDGIEGGFYIKLWRDPDTQERNFLKSRFGSLSPAEFDTLLTCLTSFNTGEIQPQYIMRYGFYEGHTFWRTDPVSIAFIFGLRSLDEIGEALNGDLYHLLAGHFTEP